MTIFGIDVSHHQDGQPDLHRARAEGIEFVFIKATEGSSLVDPLFTTNLAEARAAGMLVAAYHYLRGDVGTTEQVNNVARVVPLDVPVIIDVEANSGSISWARTFVDKLHMRGYRVPLSYVPRWYWQQLGSPSLVGLPPLWSSRYPDNVTGDIDDEWSQIPDSYWTGYGGLDVEVLQFSSSARVAGYAPVDANAYEGTRAQLASLLNGTQEEEVSKLILARTGDSDPAIWLGDMLTRRHVEDQAELDGIQFWLNQLGMDAGIKTIADLRVLGRDVDEVRAVDYDRLVSDVVTRLTAALTAAGIGGATVEQVERVVRDVFRDAGDGA